MCSRYLIRECLAIFAIALMNSCSQRSTVAQAAPDHPSTQGTAVSTLFPGGGTPPTADPQGTRYDGNAQAIAEGKRLFGWYNCSGCHFNGAGGIGPSLSDDKWIYGDSIDQIYASIHQGRPNGMPSWGAKLSTTEIWELAAFVRASAKEAASQPIPTTPTQPTPEGAAKTVNAPSPAIVDLPARPAQP